MSEILRHKSERASGGTIRRYKDEIIEIDFGAGETAPIVTLKNGASGVGICLGCIDVPCAKKAEAESKLPLGFESFPGDPSQDVCPTQALRWNEITKAIEVSTNCIGCGLCAVRCPYGAIALDGTVARVMPPQPSALVDSTPKDNFKAHPTPMRKGRLAKSTARALRGIEEVVITLADTRAMLLIRNILHELGVRCSIRRKGDTNIRMDAIVAFKDGRAGVVEVELSGAVLDSPRALLEDIAVLHGRYAIPVESIVPISIILSLPNARSEYYQVVDDIRRVLGIYSHTLTLAVLIVLLWNCARIDTLDDYAFTTQEGGANFTKSLVKAIGSRTAVLDGEPYAGAFETAK